MAFWTAQSLMSKQNALFLSLCFGVGRRSHLGFSVHHDKTHHADHRPPLPPGGAPALAAKLPARETTAGAPNGPWPASHWAASSNALVFYRPMPVPPFPFQSLIRGGGVLTADRRPADDTLHIPDRLEQPPTAIPRPTHVDDCQPPILSVTGDQDEEHPCPSAPQLWVSQEQQHAVPFPQPWRRRRRRHRQHQWQTPSGKR